MAENSKKVFTVGTFDFFHLGHLYMLEKARKLGDYLIVSVLDNSEKMKDVDLVYTLEQRIYFLKSLRFVDEIVIHKRADEIVEKIDFDIFAVGPDQNHKYFQKAFEYCKTHNKDIVVLERTKGISSTRLRENINKLK